LPLPEPTASLPGGAGGVDLAAGMAAWEQGMCSKCHGAAGEGGSRAPDLTDGEWIHCDGSVAGIRQVLVTGVPKDQMKDPSRPFAMNPATNLVSDIDALAEYVASLSRGAGG
jgi:mono/diheme cytochrome c family protein